MNREDEFRKGPRRPSNNPLLRPNADTPYNPTSYPHGLSDSLVGSPSKYDPMEFSMYQTLTFDPIIQRTDYEPVADRPPKLVHYSGYKEEVNNRLIPKFDKTLLSRGKGDWADGILASIKRFATRKRLGVADFIK